MFYSKFKKVFTCSLNEVYEWTDLFFQLIPGSIGIYLRRLYFSVLIRQFTDVSVGRNVSIRGLSGIRLGKSVRIGNNCIISARGNGTIFIGNNCSFAVGCTLNADIEGSINIGSDTLLGPDCYLRATNHCYDQLIAPRYQSHIPGVITINHSCWCGARVILLSGASVPPFSVVAAGAVVRNCFSARSLIAGIPAKVIKFL